LQSWEAETIDLPRVTLEAFADAAEGRAPYPITLEEAIHGSAVTEAIIRSAKSGAVERVP
jgi:predicted dehydrogenase